MAGGRACVWYHCVYDGHTEGALPMRVGGRSRTGASTKCGNSWLSEG